MRRAHPPRQEAAAHTAASTYDVDPSGVYVDNRVYSDEDVYQQEQERVFGRCWLFVGHESQIPRPGDYLSSYMGEDAVILCRSPSGTVHVFLNKCRHRGNRVCLFARGNTRTFTCSYHGWSYNTEGALTGVPLFEEAYLGELDRGGLRLLEAPRVQSFQGLVFASWDAEGLSLEEYLGDLRWYLDTCFTVEYLGGLQVVPGKQRYLTPGNWKLSADNNQGDHYHFPTTHVSYTRAAKEFADKGLRARGLRGRTIGEGYEVTIGFQRGVPHGLGQIRPGAEMYDEDLKWARYLGPEAVEWVTERYRRAQEHMRHAPTRPYSFTRGNVFPNFTIAGTTSALEARALILWHPRGPQQTEAWEWCAVERDAPRVVKDVAIAGLVHGQSAGGLVGPDDHENFERLAANTRTTQARRVPFHYGMSAGREASYPGHEAWHVEGLPGLLSHHTTEVNQRQFYRYWHELMRREGTGGNGCAPA